MVLDYLEPSDDFYHPEDTDRKQCRRCYKRLPRSEFNRESSRPDGLFSYCRRCFREYRRDLTERKRHDDLRYIIHEAAWSKKDKTVITWAKKLIDRFGGVDEAADIAHRFLLDAASSGRPSAVGHEFFIVLLRILQYEQRKLDKFTQSKREVREMDGRKIESELQRIIREN